jgi:hypothetical protein
MELHNNGLTSLQSATDNTGNQTMALQGNKDAPLSSPVMTLSDFQDMEQEMTLEKTKRRKTIDSRGRTVEKSNSNENLPAEASRFMNLRGKISIVATVDAISPIIAAVPTDPFALLEIYDPDEPSITAVVVMKGRNSLVYQPGIQPGMAVVLSNIRRQEWHLQDSFQQMDVPIRLHYRAPSHVFVLRDAKSITWKEDKMALQALDLLASPIIRLPPVPSTVDSLTCVQGEVISVHYFSSSKTTSNSSTSAKNDTLLHHVIVDECEYESLAESKLASSAPTRKRKRCKIYLAYFPASPDVYYGLRCGSYVRAINIHLLSSGRQERRGVTSVVTCYGACLRSTISILSNELSRHNRNDDNNDIAVNFHENDATNKIKKRDEGRSFNLPPLTNQFYAYRIIRNTYSELEWMSSTRLNICNSNDVPSSVVYNTLRTWLSNWRYQHLCKNSSSSGDSKRKQKRDPYKEWFDHACESPVFGVGEYDASCSNVTCPSNSTLGLYPVIVGMSQVRMRCSQEMKDALLKSPFINGRGPSLTADVGWTASIVFNADRLHDLIPAHADSPSESTMPKAPVYVGGKIIEISDDGSHFTKVKDGCCILPVSPTLKHNRSELVNASHQKGDFVIMRVQHAVVSCLYLGTNFSPGGGNAMNDSVHTAHLPPMGSEGRDLLGPCDVFSLKGHHYILSIHIVYHPDDIASSVNRVDRTIGRKDQLLSQQLISVTEGLMTKFRNRTNKSTDSPEGKVAYAVGRLVRSRWRVRKARSNQYDGCYITLSYLPVKTVDESNQNLVSIQSIELNIRMTIEAKNREQVKHAFSNVLTAHSKSDKESVPSTMSRDILTLACSWRSLSEDGRVCPILTGGWDDFCHPSKNHDINIVKNLGISVFVPVGKSRYFTEINNTTLSR